MSQKLFVLGLPGSGKSTVARFIVKNVKRHHDDFSATRVCDCACDGRINSSMCIKCWYNVGAFMEAIEVFLCYSHEDEKLRNKIAKLLRRLERQGQITIWYDREIGPGKEWAREIDSHLNTAQIILLLISLDFMASDYCYSLEMQKALERHTAETTRVIPIILRPVYWEDTPFSKLQVLPTNAKPVILWPVRDSAFLDIDRGIRKAIEELTAKPSVDTAC